jgi:hypothetical protein
MSSTAKDILVCGAIAIAAWVCLGITVASAAVCLPREVLLQYAQKEYKEEPAGQGLVKSQSGDILFELLLSDRGSWTIIATKPGQPTCIIASGVDWQQERIPGGGA